MSKRLPIVLAIAAALSGCSLVPDYLRPAAPVPEAWKVGAGGTATVVVSDDWRSFFADAR